MLDISSNSFRALRTVGKAARPVVEAVVIGLREAREVGSARVAAVEEAEEAVAFGRRALVAQAPHLQLVAHRAS
jgi:hypothetical protein